MGLGAAMRRTCGQRNNGDNGQCGAIECLAGATRREETLYGLGKEPVEKIRETGREEKRTGETETRRLGRGVFLIFLFPGKLHFQQG